MVFKDANKELDILLIPFAIAGNSIIHLNIWPIDPIIPLLKLLVLLLLVFKPLVRFFKLLPILLNNPFDLLEFELNLSNEEFNLSILLPVEEDSFPNAANFESKSLNLNPNLSDLDVNLIIDSSVFNI